MLQALRTKIRDQFFRILRRALDAEDGRSALIEVLRPVLRWKPADEGFSFVDDLQQTYPDLGRAPTVSVAARPIFVTSRFRSGSTFIWNVFRQLSGTTAYYEPFNERRWFEPSTRGENVDQTHRNVSDYWREYTGLQALGALYRDEWTYRDLFMDESAWDPDMRRFVETLVSHGHNRAVLQFNRIDFRLPWLRRNFPHATIVHLFRHPRDQWMSTFLGRTPFPPEGQLAEYTVEFDGFYLRTWANDLQRQFPFLHEQQIDHPYQWSYLIWKLSYLYGRRYADISLQFERLVQEPRKELSHLFDALNLECDDFERIADVTSQPALGKWVEYADDDWFVRHESRCEAILTEFFGDSGRQPPEDYENPRLACDRSVNT